MISLLAIVIGLLASPIGRFSDDLATGIDRERRHTDLREAEMIRAVVVALFGILIRTPIANGAWRELLYGVNAGGCGTIIASLANLLGWRIYVRESNRDPRFFWRLTAINFAFLAWAGVGGWLLQ